MFEVPPSLFTLLDDPFEKEKVIMCKETLKFDHGQLIQTSSK